MALGKGSGDAALLVGAVLVGLGIVWVDSRPTWDDTGISASAVFSSAALFGAARPERAWRWALAMGIWIPAYGILLRHNAGSALAMAVAFAGAYAGAFARKLLARPGGAAG
jgi:hypothetical protein